MRKFFFLFMVLVSRLSMTYGQEDSTWVFGIEANVYLIQNETILLPVIRADKNKLHLEARYNYEDLRTFSGWAGYNFSGGKKIEYAITPMIGGVTGLTNGIAPGLEFTFSYKKFEWFNESEYLFDSNTNENNYMYSWMDLTYSVKENWFIGISAQRTRLYKTNLEIQRGLIMGGGFKNWELTGYLYNLGFDAAFGIITLGVVF